MTAPSLRAPASAALPDRHPDAPAPGQLLGSHYGQCFGCGPAHPTGLHVQVVAGEGLTATGEFTVTEDHQGAPGLAHGGLLSLAFDEVLGSLAFLLRRPMVTGRLETEYLRPVPVGTTLFIDARVDGVDRRKVFVSAEGRAGSVDGTLTVRAWAVFVTVPLEHFRTHGRPQDIAAAMPALAETVAEFEVNP